MCREQMAEIADCILIAFSPNAGKPNNFPKHVFTRTGRIYKDRSHNSLQKGLFFNLQETSESSSEACKK